jgi:hypothetical protein
MMLTELDTNSMNTKDLSLYTQAKSISELMKTTDSNSPEGIKLILQLGKLINDFTEDEN